MEQIRKLEHVLADQYAKAPHLSVNARRWIADNVWWITLIGVILNIFSLFSVFSILALAGVGLAVGGAAVGGAMGATAGAALGGIVLISILLSLVLYVVEIVIFAMAVSPLKAKRQRGWSLLFLVSVLHAAINIVSGVLSFNIFSIVIGLLFSAIGAYFLFEIREYFVAKKIVEAKVVKTKKAKA